MRLDEELRQRALIELEEGLSTSVVARRIGCSVRTVQRLAREREESTSRETDADERRPGDRSPGAPQKVPSYTRPPAVDRDDQVAATERKSRPDRMAVTRRACAAVAGVLFLGASVALTGTMQLAATDRRTARRLAARTGRSTADSFRGTSPVLKIVKAIGPWSACQSMECADVGLSACTSMSRRIAAQKRCRSEDETADRHR